MRGSPEYAGSRDRRRDRSRSRSGGREHKQQRGYRDRRDEQSGSYRSRRDDYDSKHRKSEYGDQPQSGRSPRRRPRDGSRSRSRSRSPPRRSHTALPSQNESFRKDLDLPADEQPPKQKPNFKPTGLLAKEANTVVGTTTVLKYHEPSEARKPPSSQQWRMYVFKGKDLLDTVYLFQRSCWLIGRDKNITDLFVEHPSISKQHAVIQFRFSSTTNEFGDKINKVKPYVIDLESANGTRLNDNKINESRYVELVDGDVLSFGDSEREYVMMMPAPEKK